MGSSQTQTLAPTMYQNVIVMRHGDRIDQIEPLWIKTAARPWDPPLVEAGKVRASCTGRKFRTQLGFPIHRVLVSPFLRCVQTASEAVSALCALDDGPNPKMDPSKIKVSIEYGLCEMLNEEAIRFGVAPKDGKFDFNISELEAMFPAGTVDHSVERVYKELPKWPEAATDARSRYIQITTALADKFPSENLLLVTHAEGVAVAASAFAKDAKVYDVEYCAFLHSGRSISFSEGKSSSSSFKAGEFEVLTPMAQTGIRYSPLTHDTDKKDGDSLAKPTVN